LALNVSVHMKLGDGEVKSGGFSRPSMLADTVEALLGAVFLDSNYEQAYQIVVKLYEPLLTDFEPGSKQKDPKSALQEALQSAKLALPEYTLISTQGAAHQQAFEILCRVEDWGVEAAGIGASRKIAEQVAATAVLALKPQAKVRKPKAAVSVATKIVKPKQMKLKVAAEQTPV
jgi:ribonuclease III